MRQEGGVYKNTRGDHFYQDNPLQTRMGRCGSSFHTPGYKRNPTDPLY